jgi:hypothetical protein
VILWAVHVCLLAPKFTFLTDETWFHLSVYINAQNNRYLSSIDLRDTSDITLHNQKIGVCCAITATWVVWSILFEQTINSDWYVNESITEEKTMVIICKMVLEHTANYSTTVLNKEFEDRLISHRLWPQRSPNFNHRGIYLWSNLQSTVFSNNPHILDELKQRICETFTSIRVSELKLGNTIIKRLEVCLIAEGRYFEHLLCC